MLVQVFQLLLLRVLRIFLSSSSHDIVYQCLLELLLLLLCWLVAGSSGSSSSSFRSFRVIFSCSTFSGAWASLYSSGSADFDTNTAALRVEHDGHCGSVSKSDLEVDNETTLLAANK